MNNQRIPTRFGPQSTVAQGHPGGKPRSGAVQPMTRSHNLLKSRLTL